MNSLVQQSQPLSLLMVGTILFYYVKRQKKKRKAKFRFWFSFAQTDFRLCYLEGRTDTEFKKRFRMTKHAFQRLLSLLMPKIHVRRPLRLCGDHQKSYWMPPEIKLAITLRYLAGGSMLDISDNFGYNISVAYRAKDQVVKAILGTKNVGPVSFRPEDVNWLRQKTELFQRIRRNNPLSAKCVGAVDGIAIEIDKPTSEYGPKKFSNRKGFYAIVCQGLCDASCRFLLFDASCPGSTHDSVAFANTPLFTFLRQGLPENHWIACDSAYPLVGSLIKPFPGRTRVDI